MVWAGLVYVLMLQSPVLVMVRDQVLWPPRDNHNQMETPLATCPDPVYSEGLLRIRYTAARLIITETMLCWAGQELERI